MPNSFLGGANFAVGDGGEILLSETGVIDHFEFCGGGRIPVDSEGRIIVSVGVGGDGNVDFLIFVQELPETGISNKIYFVPVTSGESDTNQFHEYVWNDGAWEQIGTATINVDMSNYYTKTEVETLIADELGGLSTVTEELEDLV
jgi:hypothetical protein